MFHNWSLAPVFSATIWSDFQTRLLLLLIQMCFFSPVTNGKLQTDTQMCCTEMIIFFSFCWKVKTLSCFIINLLNCRTENEHNNLSHSELNDIVVDVELWQSYFEHGKHARDSAALKILMCWFNLVRHFFLRMIMRSSSCRT